MDEYNLKKKVRFQIEWIKYLLLQNV
jgi:hypothetical protein